MIFYWKYNSFLRCGIQHGETSARNSNLRTLIVEMKELIDNFFKTDEKEEFRDPNPDDNDHNRQLLRVVAKTIKERDIAVKAASKAIDDYMNNYMLSR